MPSAAEGGVPDSSARVPVCVLLHCGPPLYPTGLSPLSPRWSIAGAVGDAKA